MFLESLQLERGMRYRCRNYADHKANMENNMHSGIVNKDMEDG